MEKKGNIKMVLAIVNDHDAQSLQEALNKKGFQATRMASTGGFLREGIQPF